MHWRDIRGDQIDWQSAVGGRQRSAIYWRFRTGDWKDKTLGEVCDAGIRSWRCEAGWGDVTIEIFKDTLRMIARNPKMFVGNVAADAFNPEED